MACGMFVSYIYRWTYSGTSYSTTFVHSLVAFAMITTVVIMIIGNNLARAFGLMGSMAIIRFRMAIKDTQDIVFIFLSLAIGMAAGVGMYQVSIGSTLFIGMVILLLSKSRYASLHKREYLLQFQYTSDNGEDAPYFDIFRNFCKKFKLVNIKSLGETDTMVLSYYIKLKKQDAGKEFIRRIGQIEGLSNINFFFDED
ncbi:DUF4956 domain-containing protein [Candidatus Latescibacterota bacterium]